MGLLYLLALIFLINLCSLAGAAYYHCYSSGNFTPGSEYGDNRDGFLTFSMSAEIKKNNGFYYSSSVTFTSTTDVVNCLGLCRLDLVNSDSCSICISNSSNTVTNNCPVQKEVIAWGDDGECLVRCAPHDFSNAYEEEPEVFLCNTMNVSRNYATQFDHNLVNLTSSVAKKAAAQGSLSSFPDSFPQYFAVDESKLGAFGKIYVLGYCLPTLSEDSCTACLLAAANQSDQHCKGKQGATIFMPSCILRYELYRFYNPMFAAPLPSPHSGPSPPISSPSSIKKGGKVRTLVATIILGIAVVLPSIGLIIFIAKYYSNKRKKNCEDEGGAESMDSCLEFRFNTIRVATGDFSPSNMLGQGGFGVVYKGRLPNGRLIAVKRLGGHSARGQMEFRNEVQLVARLHHKNLVSLLGFCLAGNERILIYELAVNGSLDRFLFDPIRREHLNWKTRYNIIEGIARGMLYLHNESQLRIIHRDLKASNILLDEFMNSKISDFGTARLFVEDQGSASKIVGTYGYMAPEYWKHGKISEKIDVFSFGVLLLEIVSGKRNGGSENRNNIEHLLSKAWKYWITGKHLLLIDPALSEANQATEQINDITRCIHIALLSVQEYATCRPTMNSVILMLEGCSQSLPTPSKPAYFMDFKDDEPQESQPNLVQKTSLVSLSSSGFSSVNEVSITQPYPEPQ